MDDYKNIIMNFPLPDLDYKVNQKYVIFGTGEVAEAYFYRLNELYGSDVIECFIDSLLCKTEFWGKKVRKPSQLTVYELKNYKFIIGSFSSSLGMRQELLNLGVQRENIICGKNYSEDSFAKIENIQRIYIYPQISEKEILEMLIKKIMWFVPALDGSDLLIDIPTTISSFRVTLSNNIKLIDQKDKISNKDYDIVLVWNKDYLENNILKKFENVYCIDPKFFFMIDMKILVELNNIIYGKDNMKRLQETSKKNFRVFCNSHKETKTGIVCGTGPSLMEGVKKFLVITDKYSIRAACNACINSNEFMSIMQPNIYGLSDIKYLTEEHTDEMNSIIQYIRNKEESVLIIPYSWITFINKKYKGIERKVVGIQLDAKSIQFPTIDKLSIYKKAHSIVTRFVLPVVSSLCDTIYIVGCDGIDLSSNEIVLPHFETGENSIAKMNKERFDAQLFTDYTRKSQDEKDMFQKHYTYMGNMIDYGISLGKKYVALTDSYIPKLHELFAMTNNI